jgi:hypothetical protein
VYWVISVPFIIPEDCFTHLERSGSPVFCISKIFMTVSLTLMLLKVVDFRFRMLAFRGACGEPPQRFAPLRVSPVPLIPQESRTFRSNQLANEENEKMIQKQQPLEKNYN